MDYILNRYLEKLLTNALDGFFERMSEFYDERRQILKESFPEGGGLIIDSILGKQFGPSSASDWLALYSKPLTKKSERKAKEKDENHDAQTRTIRQTLLVYLGHDLVNSQTKIPANIIDRIRSIPTQFVFSHSVIHMATGLWAIDNADPALALRSLSSTSLDLGQYFHGPADLVKIILSTLTIDHNPKVALQICNIRLHENWDENQYVKHVQHVRETLNLVSVAGSTCETHSQTSGRRTPSKPRVRDIKKVISFEDSPARNTRLRKGKIK